MPEHDESADRADAGTREPRAAAAALTELADASIGVRSLLATFPGYARRWLQILHSPVRFFREPHVTTGRDFKQSIAFLLHGVIVSFIVLTMGRALPQSIATFAAVNLPLISGSSADLRRYAQRIETVGETLTPELWSSWLRQGELMLAVRVLPEERFELLVERLRALSAQRADLLARAIDGSLAGAERFGGRGYLISFFGALHPQTGPLLYQTYQITYAGPRYELPPYVEFLLSTLLLWYLVCACTAFLLRRRTRDRDTRAVFAIGALVWGFVSPLYQSLNTLLRFYLASTLPIYIPAASQLVSEPAPPSLATLSGGVFPYENLGLVVVQVLVLLALVGYATAALTIGLGRVLSISTASAFAASAVGLAVGLAITEAAMRILVLVLAPTGLL